jgi:hypothetical protein
MCDKLGRLDSWFSHAKRCTFRASLMGENSQALLQANYTVKKAILRVTSLNFQSNSREQI